MWLVYYVLIMQCLLMLNLPNSLCPCCLGFCGFQNHCFFQLLVNDGPVNSILDFTIFQDPETALVYSRDTSRADTTTLYSQLYHKVLLKLPLVSYLVCILVRWCNSKPTIPKYFRHVELVVWLLGSCKIQNINQFRPV